MPQSPRQKPNLSKPSSRLSHRIRTAGTPTESCNSLGSSQHAAVVSSATPGTRSSQTAVLPSLKPKPVSLKNSACITSSPRSDLLTLWQSFSKSRTTKKSLSTSHASIRSNNSGQAPKTTKSTTIPNLRPSTIRTHLRASTKMTKTAPQTLTKIHWPRAQHSILATSRNAYSSQSNVALNGS